MDEPGARRGRAHDAQGARDAILDAAEKVFAEHGFDGARIDAIAAAAGYNKSLIFQYFGDKLGLYAQVIRRADKSMSDLQTQILTGLAGDEAGFDVRSVKQALAKFMRDYFDYLTAHPRFMRILLWELAEGWETLSKVVSQRDMDDIDQFRPIVDKMRKAGMLRSDFDPIAQFIMVEFLLPTYLAAIPLYQIFLPGEDFSSPQALARARDYVVDFVLHGMLADPSNPKPAGARPSGKRRSK